MVTKIKIIIEYEINNDKFKGKTKAEIEEILGEYLDDNNVNIKQHLGIIKDWRIEYGK
jgi:hypothetical protein